MSKEKQDKGSNEQPKRLPAFDHGLPPVKSGTPMPKVKPLKDDK